MRESGRKAVPSRRESRHVGIDITTSLGNSSPLQATQVFFGNWVDGGWIHKEIDGWVHLARLGQQDTGLITLDWCFRSCAYA
jgi:hypothetical protein